MSFENESWPVLCSNSKSDLLRLLSNDYWAINKEYYILFSMVFYLNRLAISSGTLHGLLLALFIKHHFVLDIAKARISSIYISTVLSKLKFHYH